MQPRFSRTTWLREVNKMKDVYGAHISAEQAQKITEYMIVPIDSNIVACNLKRETANVRERDLPVEVIWQIPIDLQMSLDRFSGPAPFGKIVNRREVVMTSIRIGYGRVPSVEPIPVRQACLDPLL